jgi:hypothetical protein
VPIDREEEPVITLDRSVATRAILVGRFGLGAASLIFPRFTARLLQMDPDANPASSFLMRLFGVRDIFLGVSPLLVSGQGRSRILAAAAGVDLTDATAAVIGGLTRQIPPRASVVAAAAALAGACLSAATVGRGPLGRREPGPRDDDALATVRENHSPFDTEVGDRAGGSAP